MSYSARLRRSEEHTSELQSLRHLVCRLLLEKKNTAQARRLFHDHLVKGNECWLKYPVATYAKSVFFLMKGRPPRSTLFPYPTLFRSVPVEDPVDDFLHGDGHQRGLRRRTPEHAIAAHRRDHGVPRPHRHREVEGADDAHDAERVPLLVHAMPGALAVHGEAVKLA